MNIKELKSYTIQVSYDELVTISKALQDAQQYRCQDKTYPDSKYKELLDSILYAISYEGL